MHSARGQVVNRKAVGEMKAQKKEREKGKEREEEEEKIEKKRRVRVDPGYEMTQVRVDQVRVDQGTS